MPTPPSERVAQDRRDLSSVFALGATLLLLCTCVRLWLTWTSRQELAQLAHTQLLEVLWMGVRMDAIIASYVVAPAALALLICSKRSIQVQRAYACVALCAIGLAQVAELGFFAYYGFRLNYLVLEHGADAEVQRAIAASYLRPSWLLLAACVLALTGLAYAAIGAALQRLLRLVPPSAFASWGIRLALIPALALAARGTGDHRPLNPSAAAITTNRAANELAASGIYNVGYEAMRRLRRESPRLADLFELPEREPATARARSALRGGEFTDDSPNPLLRRVTGARPAPGLLNVVVVVMESFTGRLVGSLGGELALSPELDALSREGLLLDHCYATGERTVQGLEAVLSSFPPLPGVAVLRRPEAQTGFATLASVLGEHGYDSLFLYGGQGIFDHMRGFALGNGFKTFIEEKDFDRPDFRGSWGVSDEDLFHRANREFQVRAERGTPFFAAILTVSLHTPWEYPSGRAPALVPGTRVPHGFESEELATFLYADYAVGEFIREARTLPYFKNTVFVFVGDHGVHLQGHTLIPSEEYRVPALFLAPGHIAAERNSTVASQMDLAPTILGLLGGEFRSPFFGRDVRDPLNQDGTALLVYQKKRYGIRRADRLTVLDEGGRASAYRVTQAGDVQSSELSPTNESDSADMLAILATAEGLLEARRFTTAPQ